MTKKIKNAGILGVGIYLPNKVVTNDFWNGKEIYNLSSKKKWEDCFLGIKERRYFPIEMLPSDAEMEAGKRAIENSGIDPQEIDLVLAHSMVPDETVPDNASLIQYKLGLKNAGAWNMDTCCSSFVSMFICASSLIASGFFKKILIVTSIFHSKIMDPNDYLAPTLGDGASAVVMGEVSEGRGYISSHCTSDGYYHDTFTVRERLPWNVTHRKHYEKSPLKNYMTTNIDKAREMGRNSINWITEVMENTLEKGDVHSSEIDFFFSHQPCHWAHDTWRDILNISDKKSLHTFDIYGNLASTSIPVSIFHALEQNKIKDGDTILMVSPGAGENHASAIFKWGK